MILYLVTLHSDSDSVVTEVNTVNGSLDDAIDVALDSHPGYRVGSAQEIYHTKAVVKA